MKKLPFLQKNLVSLKIKKIKTLNRKPFTLKIGHQCRPICILRSLYFPKSSIIEKDLIIQAIQSLLETKNEEKVTKRLSLW